MVNIIIIIIIIINQTIYMGAIIIVVNVCNYSMSNHSNAFPDSCRPTTCSLPSTVCVFLTASSGISPIITADCFINSQRRALVKAEIEM